MKERPILFSGPMVRALLDGSKTQTRRIVKPPYTGCLDAGLGANTDLCPYGQPGDRLWVREAFRFSASLDLYSPAEVGELALNACCRPAMTPTQFEADGVQVGLWRGFETMLAVSVPGKYRPPMFMPRWASRMTLEITEVRVERLQDISEADALAEGIVRQPDGGYGLADTTHYHFTDPRQSYFSLWEAINGAGSWDANPWVWVVSFRRLP